jgi:hypothetical protein
MDINQFDQELRALIGKANSAKMPLAACIMVLNEAVFELNLSLVQIKQEAMARQMSQKIVPSTVMPPGRNGK